MRKSSYFDEKKSEVAIFRQWVPEGCRWEPNKKFYFAGWPWGKFDSWHLLGEDDRQSTSLTKLKQKNPAPCLPGLKDFCNAFTWRRPTTWCLNTYCNLRVFLKKIYPFFLNYVRLVVWQSYTRGLSYKYFGDLP